MWFCNYNNEKNINLKICKSILISRLPNGIVQILNRYIQAELIYFVLYNMRHPVPTQISEIKEKISTVQTFNEFRFSPLFLLNIALHLLLSLI